jgi:hypothetical protein
MVGSDLAELVDDALSPIPRRCNRWLKRIILPLPRNQLITEPGSPDADLSVSNSPNPTLLREGSPRLFATGTSFGETYPRSTFFENCALLGCLSHGKNGNIILRYRKFSAA